MSITLKWTTFLKTYVTLVSMVCGSKRVKKIVLDICLSCLTWLVWVLYRCQHRSYECRSKAKNNYLGHRSDMCRAGVIGVSDTATRLVLEVSVHHMDWRMLMPPSDHKFDMVILSPFYKAWSMIILEETTRAKKATNMAASTTMDITVHPPTAWRQQPRWSW